MSTPSFFRRTGIPHNIPAKQGASFIISWLDTAATSEKDDNIYPNTNLVYTLQNVVKDNDSACSGNVDVNLGFNRVTHQKELKSEYFALGLHCASAVIEGLNLSHGAEHGCAPGLFERRSRDRGGFR